MHKNPVLKDLIVALEKQSKKQKVKIWNTVAQELASPTRSQRSVNVKKVSMYTQKDDTVLVPGKLLGTGTIDHAVTVVAHKVSTEAAQKITAAGGKVKTLQQEMKDNPKGSKLRILG
jgi:large subunit ribosomal protein L18e